MSSNLRPLAQLCFVCLILFSAQKADAQHTFSTFDTGTIEFNVASHVEALTVGDVPAGEYLFYQVRADFIPGSPTSALSADIEMQLSGGGTTYMPYVLWTAGAHPDMLETEIVWTGLMKTPYQGGDALSISFRDNEYICGCGEATLENVEVSLLPGIPEQVDMDEVDSGLITGGDPAVEIGLTGSVSPGTKYGFFRVTGNFQELNDSDAFSDSYEIRLHNGSGTEYFPFTLVQAGWRSDEQSTEVVWSGVLQRPYVGGDNLTLSIRDIYSCGCSPPESELNDISVTLYPETFPSQSFVAFDSGTIRNGDVPIVHVLDDQGVPDTEYAFYSVTADFIPDFSGPEFAAWSDAYEMGFFDNAGNELMPFGVATSGIKQAAISTTLVWTGLMLNPYQGNGDPEIRFRDVLPTCCGLEKGRLENVEVRILGSPLNSEPLPNNVPQAEPDLVQTPEDTPVTISVLDNDVDSDGDALSVSIATQPTHGAVVVNPDGTITYTPDPEFNGEDRFDYNATDPSGASDGEAVRITVTPVNDPPMAVDDAAETDESTPVDINVLVNDSDTEGPLSIQAVSSPEHGTATDNGDGTVTYEPTAGYSGPDTFIYTITDGSATAEATVSITILLINDPPAAVDDQASVYQGESVHIDLLGNDTEPEGGALTVTAIGTASLGEVTDNGDGTITYQADAGAEGIDIFTYTIQDPDGATGTAIVRVMVSGPGTDGDGIDDATEDAGPNGGDANKDGIPDSEQGNVTAVPIASGPNSGKYLILVTEKEIGLRRVRSVPNPSPDDFPGSAEASVGFLEFTLTGIDTGASTLVTLILPEGVPVAEYLKYGPTDSNTDDHWYGFRFEESSGTGAVIIPAVLDEGTGAEIQPTRVQLHFTDGGRGDGDLTANGEIRDPGAPVIALNALPVATADEFATQEDVAVLVDPLANDSDPDGDALELLSVSSAGHGMAVLETGLVRYTPEPDFFGSDAFTYIVSDGNGGVVQGMVAVTVTSVQDAPVAVADSVSVSWNHEVIIPIFANDHDPDGDDFWLASMDQPDHGEAVYNHDGTVTFTPPDRFTGEARWAYSISDGPAHSDEIVFGSIVVSVVNHLPVFPTSKPITSPAEGEVVHLGTTTGDPQDPLTPFTLEMMEATDADGDAISYGYIIGADPTLEGDVIQFETSPVTETAILFYRSILQGLGVDPGLGGEVTLYQRAVAYDGLEPAFADIQSFSVVRGRLVAKEEGADVPVEFHLDQNYPNPFNPSTTIEYGVPKTSHVRLDVFDMTGRLVRTLVNGSQSAGNHRQTLRMDGLPSGMYVYRLEANGDVLTNTLHLIK